MGEEGILLDVGIGEWLFLARVCSRILVDVWDPEYEVREGGTPGHSSSVTLLVDSG
jgi:hypothetical protein